MRHALLLLLIFAVPATAQEKKKGEEKKKPDSPQIMLERLIYPLGTCPVSSNPLDGKMGPTIELIEKGRLIRICCNNCREEVKGKNVDRILKRIDAEYIARQRPRYPLTTCSNCDKKLGDTVHDVLSGVRLVRLCCKACVEGFRKAPAPQLKKLDAAIIKSQKPKYKFTHCPVSGKKLADMPKPHDHVFHNSLVRLCCAKCPATFDGDPKKYIDKLLGKKEKVTKKPAGTTTTLLVDGMT